MEKTFIMIKPDGLERKLMGEVIARIERKGFKINKVNLRKAPRDLVEEHYVEHKDKDFLEN